MLLVISTLLALRPRPLRRVDDPIGALATLLPVWVLVPFLVAAVLALVSGAVLGTTPRA